MAGYRTWKRKLEPGITYQGTPGKYASSVRKETGTLHSEGITGGGFSHPLQVTTSYRTDGEDASNEAGPNSVLQPGSPAPANWGAAFQQIRSSASVDAHDRGNTFRTDNQRYFLSHPSDRNVSDYGTYIGPVYPDWMVGGYGNQGHPFPVIPETAGGYLNFQGTIAVNRTMPRSPVANLAEFLIELKREGLPRLLGITSFKHARKGGFPTAEMPGEYLNLQFGWKPVINDTVKLLSAVVDAEKHLKQYVRDSGRQVRRSYTFPEEHWLIRDAVWTSSNSLFHRCPSTTNDAKRVLGQGAGSSVREVITGFRQTYFSGAFTYHLPESLLERYMANGGRTGAYTTAIDLLGIELSPSVLWNVAPWSWLFDWLFDIGEIIENLEAFKSDGLVMRYGYLMTRTVYKRTLTGTDSTRINGTNRGPTSITFISERKERTRASPFGFGLDPSSFTNRQWSILAALGMTKGNSRQLRHGD